MNRADLLEQHYKLLLTEGIEAGETIVTITDVDPISKMNIISCVECISCKNCILCVKLNNVGGPYAYYLLNKSVSKIEFDTARALILNNFRNINGA